MIDFTHPANLRPYSTLGTHPEIVERLWDELGGPLPMRCRWCRAAFDDAGKEV